MWILIALFTLVVILIHWYLTSPYKYWKKRGVIHPEPKLLFGNLGESILLTKNLGQIYEEIYNKYQDLKYVGYYKFRQPAILVRDIELVKTVLVKEFSSFHDNDIEADETIDPYWANNPFVLRGRKWKDIRSLVTSEITTSKIKNMLYLMTNISKTLVTYLENEKNAGNKGNGIEAKELAGKFTTDVVASCAFGLEAKSFTNEMSEFREMGRKFLMPTFWNGVKFVIMFVMPPLARILRVRLMPTEVQKWFEAIVIKTMEYRKQNNIVRHDYLDMLIGLKSKANFTDKDVIAQALTFYADGFETSSITISQVWYELAANPKIQDRLRNEIDTVLAKYNGEITYEAIQEMQYMDMVISESLRKSGPALFMVRVCTKPIEFPPAKENGPNLIIEPGTPIAIPLLGIHADPQYYPNPQTFDPERFTDENINARAKYTYLAFGEGPRICLGFRFAQTQMKVALIATLANFIIKVNPKTQEPLQMDPKFFLNNTIGGLWLNFIKRHK